MFTQHLRPPLLCLITDPVYKDLIPKVEKALEAGIQMVQLRGKQLSALELYQSGLPLRACCQHYGVPLIVNDRLDVGLALQADGFQLGKNSLPLSVARQIVGESSLLGSSIHTLEEAQSAVEGGADYLLAGTIFASPSHPGGAVVGLELLRSIRAVYKDHLLLAIGGMTSNTARQAIDAGADGIAVISAILQCSDVTQAVQALKREIEHR